MTKEKSKSPAAPKPAAKKRSIPATYGACARRDLGKPHDPAAPAGKTPSRGVGSNAAKATAKPLTWHGHTMSRNAWCRYLRISRSALRYRLAHHTVEEALDPNFREKVIADLVESGKWPRRQYGCSPKKRASCARNAAKAHAAYMENTATRVAAFGEEHTVTEWAEILGVNRHTLDMRLRRMPVEVALRTGRMSRLIAPPKPAESPKPSKPAAKKGRASRRG